MPKLMLPLVHKQSAYPQKFLNSSCVCPIKAFLCKPLTVKSFNHNLDQLKNMIFGETLAKRNLMELTRFKQENGFPVTEIENEKSLKLYKKHKKVRQGL